MSLPVGTLWRDGHRWMIKAPRGVLSGRTKARVVACHKAWAKDQPKDYPVIDIGRKPITVNLQEWPPAIELAENAWMRCDLLTPYIIDSTSLGRI
jgi:hypothetical protein